MAEQPNAITNRAIANHIGASIATVSRLRSGDRNPSFAMMQRISGATDWTVAEQSTARAQDRWHVEFERVCREKLAS